MVRLMRLLETLFAEGIEQVLRWLKHLKQLVCSQQDMSEKQCAEEEEEDNMADDVVVHKYTIANWVPNTTTGGGGTPPPDPDPDPGGGTPPPTSGGGGGSGVAYPYNLPIPSAGWINFYTGYQRYTTFDVERYAYVARSHGTSGTATVNYTISAGYNGSFSDIASGTISWADGEGGYQPIAVTPTDTGAGGPNWIHISLSNATGSSLGCREYVICVDDSSVPPAAHCVFASNTGNDSNDGTIGSPYLSVSAAIAGLGGVKQLVVLRDGIFNLANEPFEDPVGYGGQAIRLPKPSNTGLQTSHQNRCYIMSYPGEYAQILDSVAPGGNRIGFFCRGGSAGHYTTIYNLEVGDTTSLIIGNNGIYNANHVHILSCYFHNGDSDNFETDNYAAVFMEANFDTIIADVKAHDYKYNGSGTNNTAGVIDYTGTRTMVSNCTFYDANHGIYYKEAVEDTSSWHMCVHGLLIYAINGSETVNQGILMKNDNSGQGGIGSGGGPYQNKNYHIANNILVDCRFSTDYNTVGIDVKGACLEHNTIISDRACIEMHEIIDPVGIANVLESGGAFPPGGVNFMRDTSSVRYFNYNLYNPSDGTLWQKNGEFGGPKYTTFFGIRFNYGSIHETQGIDAAPVYVDSVNANVENRDYNLASGSRGRADVDLTHDGENRGAYFIYKPGIF